MIVLCLLSKFPKNTSSSYLAPVHVMNILLVYRNYSIDLFLMKGYIAFQIVS